MGMPFLPVSEVEEAHCENRPVEVTATAATEDVFMKFRRLIRLIMVYKVLVPWKSNKLIAMVQKWPDS